MKGKQTRFTMAGELIAEPLIEGDSGEQLDLFGPPSQTGESLAIETAGPMFADQSNTKGDDDDGTDR